MVLSSCLAAFALVAAPPITVHEVARTLPDGQPLRGWVARVDLGDPRVSFVVPGPPPSAGAPRAEARLAPVDAWAAQAGAVLAVNANFFARPEGAPRRPWVEGEPVDILGLSVSDGVAVSAPRGFDPALLIDETRGGGRASRCPCRARIGFAARADLGGIDEAVAGMGAAPGSGPATLLVQDGVNRGSSARVQPLARHPRTAAGLTRDGGTLILLVVDGRRPGWSAGATLVELADLIRELGAHTALNLDGGGSTAMWHRDAAAPQGRVLNRPSDGRVRPVANTLAVRVSASPAP